MDQKNKVIFVEQDLKLKNVVVKDNQELVYILIPINKLDFYLDVNVIQSSKLVINFIVLAEGTKTIDCKINTNISTNDASVIVKSLLFANDKSKINIEINSFVEKYTTNNVVDQSIIGTLLSSFAKISGNPNLKIHALDVKAKHSLKIGSLDKEELFYLMSKGFSLIETKKIIVDSYLNEFLSSLDLEQKKYYLNLIMNKII